MTTPARRPGILAAIGRFTTKAASKVGMRFSGYGGEAYSSGSSHANFPYLRYFLPGAKYDYELEAADTWRNGCVAICLSWIKKNFPEPRPIVREREGLEQEQLKHPLIKILNKPNGFYSSDVMWAGISLSWYCEGDAYLMKLQNAAGQTAGFMYVPHWQLFPRWPNDGSEFISHYDYIVDGVRIKIQPSQIVHFRNGIDPHNTRHGHSELKAQLREIVTDNQAATFTAAILRNMGVPGFAISPEDPAVEILEEDRKAIKKVWREEFTGENSGGLLVNSVRLKLDKISSTPEELVLDKIRNIPEARIHGAIGLNPIVTGQNVGSTIRTYTNYGEARKAAYYDCIVPLQKQLGKQLSDQCPELVRPDHILAWDYSGVEAMQEIASEKGRRAVILFQGQVARRNEARAIAGLKPDTSPEGDIYHVGPEMKGALPGLGGNAMSETMTENNT